MKLAVLIFGMILPVFCIALPEKTISSEDLDNGAVALDGLWAFDWQELHTDSELPMRDGLMLPGLWHKQGPYTPQGFATIRLTLNMPVKAPYYLRVPDIPSAMSLWVNGQLLLSRGVVSNEMALEQPRFGPEVIALPPADQYQLILHVSNHHHKDGGVWHNLLISDQGHKTELQDQSKIIDAMIFSFLMLASVYLLVINVSRHGHVSHLLFAVFIWAIALRSVMVGERIAYDFISGVTWESWQRLEHILLFVALPCFVYFFHRFFSIKNMLFAHFVFIVSVFLGVSTLFYPAIIFTHFAQVNQILGLITVVYMLIFLPILIKQETQYSVLFFISFIGAAIFVIHDYLYTHLLIQSRPLSQFGMVFFVALQVYMLWLHRKNDMKLMMFVKSTIDRKATDINKECQDKESAKPFSISQWVLELKPYCDVLNVSIVFESDEVFIVIDKDKLQNIILILARMADKNGMRAKLLMSQEHSNMLFTLSFDKAFNAQKIAADDMNAVHRMLNDIGLALSIKRMPKSSNFEFNIPVFNQASGEVSISDTKFIGNELASSILYQGDDSGVLEESLKDYFFLVDTVISKGNIIKHRPNLIIWQVDQLNAYNLDDLKSVISEFSSIPILLIIGHHQKAQLAQCIRLGVTDYIITPVLPEELLLKVQRAQGGGNELALPVSTQDVRDVTVQLVRSSIELWQKYSSKSKVDLAESSRLWRVYVDGSTAKTRTLDKYLSLQTLPKNPRWETVSRTAVYVLEECELNEKDNKSLSQQLSLFNRLLAT